MKIPKSFEPLVRDGLVDEVIRPLKSGKEAAVYVVQRGDEVLCAKVYKDMAQRSFQARVQYQEGRKVRGSRAMRAMGKAPHVLCFKGDDLQSAITRQGMALVLVERHGTRGKDIRAFIVARKPL